MEKIRPKMKLFAIPFLVLAFIFAAYLEAQAGGGTWAPTGSMSTPRYQGFAATLLPNGKILVAGGTTDSVAATTSAELYDPSTGTWTPTGSMNVPRSVLTDILLPNGKVLVVGGQIGGPQTATAELYDPSTGMWTLTGSMSVPRVGHVATLLPNGQVLVTGGTCCGGNSFKSAELYDPSTGMWTLTGSMSVPRSDHFATLLLNGEVLVFGGSAAGGVAYSSAEFYNPASGTFTATGSMSTSRDNGGTTDNIGVLLPNGKVLAAGGSIAPYSYDLSSSELYDPGTGLWTLTGSMNVARDGHTLTMLLNGKVLAEGGGSNGIGALASAELYDQGAGTWTFTGSMTTPRTSHRAVLLPNGQVLATGGAGGGVVLASAELYSPVTYNFIGFLDPILNDGSRIFKLGSTVPVKFQLTDANGAYVSTAKATLTVQMYSGGTLDGTPIDATSSGGSDTGNLFRYDSTSNQYVYNLSTKPLSTGTWQIQVQLDDGTIHTVLIGLK